MSNFDDIRPFNADEIPAATQRMADSSVIPAIEVHPVDEIRQINYPAKSRKPIKFIDLRNRQ